MKHTTQGVWALVSLSMAAPSLAHAQTQAIDNFGRDRNVSVRQRPHPGFEAVGGRLGAFTFYPKIEVRAETNDNVYGTDTNTVDDTVGHITPSAALASGWSRHALTLYADADIVRYADRDDESHETYRGGFTSRVDLARSSSLGILGSTGKFVEPRTNANTPASADAPIEYSLSDFTFSGVKTFNRFRAAAGVTATDLNYEDGRTTGGVVIDQDIRDRAVYDVMVRGDYAISPATAIFAKATRSVHEYDKAGTLLQPARDSEGYELLTGVDFDLTNLARGEVAVGYFTQDFDSSLYDKTDGYAVRAQVEYFPTQLTTVTATASRSFQDAALIGAGGYISSNLGIRVDLEVRRNVILTGAASYSDDEYDGIDRTDERTSLSAGATYLMNRNVGLTLSYSRLEQDSSGASAGTDFAQQRLAISLVTQF